MEIEQFEGFTEHITDPGVKRFGAKVRALRQARGMTQAGLARMMSMTGASYHQTMIGKIENGTRPTSIKEALLLAVILGVDVTEFFTDDDPKLLVLREMERRAGELSRLASDIADAVERMEAMRAEYDEGVAQYEALEAELNALDEG